LVSIKIPTTPSSQKQNINHTLQNVISTTTQITISFWLQGKKTKGNSNIRGKKRQE